MTFIITKPWAYYNDFDEKTCDWLEELIRLGVVAPGEVDRRSIVDVQPEDVKGFCQVHWFCGIGGWSYALRLIGWPDEAHVWTGSPPCQPFSSAGRQKGKDDERHLAPKFAELVGACRPGLLFGEQVASAEVFGKAPKKPRKSTQEPPQWAWLDDLLDRLEAARYAVGASDLPSASIGAPHIRQRTHFGAVNLEWLADANSGKWDWCRHARPGRCNEPSDRSDIERLADADDEGLERRWQSERGCSTERAVGQSGVVDRLADADSGLAGQRGNAGSAQVSGLQSRLGADGRGDTRGMADADGRDTSTERQQRGGEQRQQPQDGRSVQVDHRGWTSPLDGPWRTADWLFCRDAKWRPVEARPQQMADGLPVDLGHSGDLGADEGSWGRIAESLAQEEIGFPLGKVEYARATRLRGYGNAINPWLAAEFIASFLDALRGGADELSGQSPLELSKVRQRDLEDLL